MSFSFVQVKRKPLATHRAMPDVAKRHFSFGADVSLVSLAPTSFVERSRSEWWRMGEIHSAEAVIPGRERAVAGDRPQTLEEALAGNQVPGGCPPGPVSQFDDGIAAENRQIEDRGHRRQMLFAVTEIVLEVLAVGLQDIEALVFDLPPGPPSGREFGDILPAAVRVGLSFGWRKVSVPKRVGGQAVTIDV